MYYIVPGQVYNIYKYILYIVLYMRYIITQAEPVAEPGQSHHLAAMK